MYPILREIDFNTVRIVHFFISITGFHFTQYFIHVDSRCQLDLVLRGEIGRIGLAQLGQGHTFFGQIGQEKRGADQCVAAVVQFGVDDPAVALAADDGSDLLHFSNYIDLSDCRCMIFSSVHLRYIA